MIKNVSVDTKSTREKEKNINEEKNKEYEEMLDRVRMFIFFKNLKKKTTQYMPENIEEIHISHAMCTYTVSFYAIGEQAIFEYFDDDGIQSYEVDREDFINWLTDEEEKKVLDFEREMREKHIKRMESKKKINIK